jgi:hypothetical protein
MVLNWVTNSLLAVSTIAIAIFAYLTWRLSKQQDKMYNDPDIRVHGPAFSIEKSIPEKGEIWNLKLTLINLELYQWLSRV